jgi:hypothetical protein
VTTADAGPQFRYSDLLPTAGSNGAEETPYRLITTEGVSTVEVEGRTFLKVEPEAIRRLTEEAMHDISHYLRPSTRRTHARHRDCRHTRSIQISPNQQGPLEGSKREASLLASLDIRAKRITARNFPPHVLHPSGEQLRSITCKASSCAAFRDRWCAHVRRVDVGTEQVRRRAQDDATFRAYQRHASAIAK